MNSTKVRNIMTHDPFIIGPEKTVKDAAKLMKDIECGVLPVGTGPEYVVGMITDRDITVRVSAEGKDASQTRIADVMTPRVHSCDVETSIEDAAEQMRKHEVCRLIVTNENRAAGIVTLAEILRNKRDRRASENVLHELLGARRNHHAKEMKKIAFAESQS